MINNLLGQDVATVSATEKSDEELETIVAPKNENVKIFEIPAITGLELTKDNFFERANFDGNKYDFVNFLTKGGLTSDDIFIIKEIQKRQIPINVLRTNTEAASEKGDCEEIEKALDKIRRSLKSKMEKYGVNLDKLSIYCVDNKRKLEFDLRRSIKKVMESLPPQKQEILRCGLDDLLLTEVNTNSL